MMGFLAAQGSGHDSCLYRAACEYPEAGMEYAQAGHATLTGVEIFSRFVNEKGHCNSHDSHFICLFHRTTKDQQYERMLSGLEKAAKEGLRNAPCSLLYKCPL